MKQMYICNGVTEKCHRESSECPHIEPHLYDNSSNDFDDGCGEKGSFTTCGTIEELVSCVPVKNRAR